MGNIGESMDLHLAQLVSKNAIIITNYMDQMFSYVTTCAFLLLCRLKFDCVEMVGTVYKEGRWNQIFNGRFWNFKFRRPCHLTNGHVHLHHYIAKFFSVQ